MLHLSFVRSDDHRNNVEPGIQIKVVFDDVSLGGAHQCLLFGSCYSKFGLTEPTCRSCFYFHNHLGIFIHGHDVNLFAAKMPVEF